MKWNQRFKLGAGAGLVTMLLGALMVLAPGVAGAEHLGSVLPAGTVELPANGGPVPICHATSAETNPYIRNTPNVSATGEFFGSNHASHTGPVFAPGMKSARPKVQWGDIIPPVAVDGHLVFAGSQNWLTGGAEQYASCSAVVAPAAPVLIVEKTVPGEAVDPTEFGFTVVKLLQGQQVEQVDSDSISDGESFETTVPVGQIRVSETVGDDHTLTGVACTRDYADVEDEVVTVSLQGSDAVFAAAAGDVITCTFTNTPVPEPTSSITVDKTNNANGSLPFGDTEQASGPGVAVPFQVVLTNTGSTALTLQTLTDTWTGLATPIDLFTVTGFACTRGAETTTVAAGTELPAGSVTTCTFSLPGYSPTAGGSKINTVAVSTTTEGVGDDDTSTVTTPGEQIVVIPTPPTPSTFTLDVDKRNDADGDGVFRNAESALAEGDDVTFRVIIRNTGSGAVTLTSLTDAFDGELVDLLGNGVDLVCNGGAVTLTAGSVLAPGSTTTCTFTLEDYAPSAGESLTNTVTVDTDQVDDTDTSTVDTEEVEVLPEEETPPVVTPPVVTPPAVVPVAQPQAQKPQVLGVQTVRALPRTGDETRGLAGAGAVMLALGAAMVLGSKRRFAQD